MVHKYLIRYSLWNIHHDSESKNIKESKYDNFESEIYNLYKKISLEKGNLPDATILINSEEDIETINNIIQKKFKNKYEIKRFIIVEYINDVHGFYTD